MLRSLYSAVSGLRNHQTRMDVIGNNIANVNTYGFKSSRVTFQDAYSQTSKPASGASTNLGGTNPMQIGLGMSVATIDLMMNGESPVERTDRPLDIAIAGDGFFILNDGVQNYYSRVGNFYIDNEGNLVNGNGLKVMGKMADTTGTFPLLNGSSSNPGDVYDPSETEFADREDPAELVEIVIPSNFIEVSVDKNGLVTGIDESDGLTYVIGVVGLARFVNPSGVSKVGDSLYTQSNNSGTPSYGRPGDDGFASLNIGGLEMSNVDLSKEFTDMIVTQRGFQANSRVITVSDTLLEELINLKR